MPAVPTVPGSEISIDFVPGVKRQPLLGAARGKAVMGQAFENVGDQFHGLAMDVQRAKNAGVAADISLKLRNAHQTFLEGLRNSPNEETWGQQATETAERTMQAINEAHPSLAPEMKPQIKQAFDSWQSDLQIKAQTMAHTQAINRAWGLLKEDYDEKLKDGQADDALAVLQTARAGQVADPAEIDRLEREIPQKVDSYAAMNLIVQNPIIAVEFLQEKDANGNFTNFTQLDSDNRFTLMQAARGAATKARTDFQNEIAERRFSGEVIGDAELNEAVQGKMVTPAWAKSFKRQQALDLGRAGATEAQATEFGALRTQILAYDPTQDTGGEYEKLFSQAQLLPERMATDAINTLKQKADVKNVLNSPVAKDAFEGIDKRFTLGLYGKFETKVMDKEGNFTTVVNPKVFESAMTVKRRVEDATRKYMNDNPNATAAEVNDFVSSVQMQNVVKSGRQTVLGSVAPSMPLVNEDAKQKKARLDAILDKAKKAP